MSPESAPRPARRPQLDQPHGDRVLVIIPTYDERENLPLILDRLFAAVPAVHVLVADDGSPDGTGEIADERAAADERIHVMHRTVKAGLGAAYVDGFGWGLERGYDVLVEMDADGSHAPEQLPRLLDALQHADVVLGSRYVAGGTVVDWPKRRELLSRGGNLYSRFALGVRIYDITGGYRAYRSEVLQDHSARPGGLARLLLPGRPGVAGRAGRVPGDRGADHVHRTGDRHVQDERRHRPGGADEGDLVGRQAPLAPVHRSVRHRQVTRQAGRAQTPNAAHGRWAALV